MSTKRADGRKVKTVTIGGKKHYFYGNTEREINEKILRFREEVKNGRALSAIASEWWEMREPELAVQTAQSYRPAIRDAVDRFGPVPVSQITPQDVAAYLYVLQTRGYAAKTLSNRRLVLSLIFAHAMYKGETQSNPVALVPVPKDAKKKGHREAATPEDERRVRENPAPDFPAPFIAINTGMRLGEILALTWADVDFSRGVIRVSKSVAHDESGRPVVKAPKTESGNRLVPLLGALSDFLRQIKGKPGEYVCGDISTSNKMSFQRKFKKYQEQIGITCTMHQLRHSFATVAFEAGLQPADVQHILGHAQISTTMDIYTDWRQASLQRAAQALEKHLNA